MSLRRVLASSSVRWTLIVLVTLGVGIGGLWYWRHSQRYASTDDAYVGAHVIRIAPQVSGEVIAVHVHNNQRVDKGTVLFEIDPRPFQVKIAQAEAGMAYARQSVAQKTAVVAQADADLAQKQADLRLAQSTYERDARLAGRHYVSAQATDNARSSVSADEAAVESARAALQAAKASLGAKGDDNVMIRGAKAYMAAAKLDLSHTKVYAPEDGYITEMNLRPGAVVTADQPLFAFVVDKTWWLDANFKETELARIRPGEKARIRVDMYPDHVYHGIVESLSAGSGTAFSLLPPENATGNWVKVTQRVPVRVMVTDTPDPKFPLRVGTSGSVTVQLGS